MVRAQPSRILAAIALWAAMAGCSPSSSGGGVNVPNLPFPAEDELRVRILNNTAYVLDPRLFVTSGSALTLFDRGNQLTNIGTGGLGLVADHSFSVVDLSCDQVRFLGSDGGIFYEQGAAQDEVGRAGQLTAAGDIIPFGCGDTVTLTFSPTPSGDGFLVDLRRD